MTNVTIEAPGMEPIHTTSEIIREVGNKLERENKRRATKQDEPATRFAKDQLKALVERIVRLEDEKKTFADDIKEVYGEAKSNGFDTKALRRVVKLQRMDQSQKAAHNEVETILETYMQALGML